MRKTSSNLSKYRCTFYYDVRKLRTILPTELSVGKTIEKKNGDRQQADKKIFVKESLMNRNRQTHIHRKIDTHFCRSCTTD